MNVERLTIGEIAKVEELAGMGIAALGDDKAPKGKLLAALAFVTKRRQDPTFRFEDAMNMTMEEIGPIIGLDEEDEDPKLNG